MREGRLNEVLGPSLLLASSSSGGGKHNQLPAAVLELALRCLLSAENSGLGMWQSRLGRFSGSPLSNDRLSWRPQQAAQACAGSPALKHRLYTRRALHLLLENVRSRGWLIWTNFNSRSLLCAPCHCAQMTLADPRIACQPDVDMHIRVLAYDLVQGNLVEWN